MAAKLLWQRCNDRMYQLLHLKGALRLKHSETACFLLETLRTHSISLGRQFVLLVSSPLAPNHLPL